MTRAPPQLARGLVPAELAPARLESPRAPERRQVLERVSVPALEQQERPQPARRWMMPFPR